MMTREKRDTAMPAVGDHVTPSPAHLVIPSSFHAVSASPAPVDALREVVRQYGTPTYAYDLTVIRRQVARLREHLPRAVEVFYSFKANASLGLGGFLADCGLGADVASAGQLL